MGEDVKGVWPHAAAFVKFCVKFTKNRTKTGISRAIFWKTRHFCVKICKKSVKFSGNWIILRKICKNSVKFWRISAKKQTKKHSHFCECSFYITQAGLQLHVSALGSLARNLHVNLTDDASFHERAHQGRNGSGLQLNASRFDEHGGGHRGILAAHDLE